MPIKKNIKKPNKKLSAKQRGGSPPNNRRASASGGKDTPPAERYAGIIAEDFDSKLDLVLENMQTIKAELSRENADFKFEVMKGFAKVDLRFSAIDQKFDRINQKFDRMEKELKQEIQGVESRLGQKIDQLGERVTIVETDVEKLKEEVVL